MNRRFLPLLALPALLATTKSETAARLGGTPAEPVFDPSQSRMLFQQNFDTYTTDSLRFPCSTTPAPNRLVDHAIFYCNTSTPWKYDAGVIVGPGHSGNGVQIHYDGVYQETHGVITTVGTGGALAPTGKAATVVQYWAKFTPDKPGALTTRDAKGVGDAIIQIKNIMLWHDARGESGRFQAHLGHTPATVRCLRAELHDGGWARLGAGGLRREPAVGPFFKDFANGQWHRWTVLFKPNTSSGSRDGIARVWIDGSLVVRIEKSACSADVRANGSPVGGWKSWCTFAELDGLSATKYGIRALEWGANRTDGSGIAFTMAIDDVKWWVAKS